MSLHPSLKLYRDILRLHRSLPKGMRFVGDSYVKDEFRRHKTAEASFVKPFIAEWTRYKETLEKQIGVLDIALQKDAQQQQRPPSSSPSDNVVDLMDNMNEQQIGQLFVLREEIKNLSNKKSKK